ncbi:GDSL-type esterase/lipase family protein [Asticcacaulis solisilvae]|uniref:GDSL-type esterase/lipase family protein n=1 Tax=Asticcacaulis solisilvae TaxID=1217274 RepID=UPI003FD7DAE2
MDRRKLLTGGLMAGGAILAGQAAAQASGQAATPQATIPATQVPEASPVTPPEASDAARVVQAPPAPPSPNIDWANLKRYRQANIDAMALAPAQRSIVMMGDSITDNWAKPEHGNGFFDANGMIGRGISGQVTGQMLIRFPPDVLALKPRVVHILAGTNDIAENQDPYDPAVTTGNLLAMITLARANGLKVIVGSVPPATSFAWRPSRGNPLQAIKALNDWTRGVCAKQKLVYADYWPVLQGPDGGLKPELGINGDSVHPNAAGYAAMAPVLLAAVKTALSKG